MRTSRWIDIGVNQIKSNQIKSNQIKSNQIKSNQIKSTQINSNQLNSNQLKSNQIKNAPRREGVGWFISLPLWTGWDGKGCYLSLSFPLSLG
jgi:hypothetical protein